MKNNDCFRANRKIRVKGLMLHSTATPGVRAKDWYLRWNKSFKAGEMARQVCVHAFLDDEEVYQYLPWNHRGWHAGGSANNTHIGVEMCEPSGFKYSHGSMVGYNPAQQRLYFERCWNTAVALFALLCKEFNLTEKDIIDHVEGSKLGIASHHQDTAHWFSKHGKDMNDFRRDVKKLLGDSESKVIVTALADRGITSSKNYWVDVMEGRVVMKPEYLKTLLSRIILHLK